MSSKLFRIRGAVQTYDWGGYSYIRALLGDSAKPESPIAEYWLGTHPNAPAMAILDSGEQVLAETLASMDQPSLSFLMKILDVRMMLSIQVHPSLKQAEAGFAREEAAGIGRNAYNRTYKDNNHKPELMFALSRFYMLHGLRPRAELESEFSSRPSCSCLLEVLDTSGMEGLVAAVLDPEDPRMQDVVTSLLDEIARDGGPFGKLCPEFWIQRWLQDNPGVYTGILMILLMNIIELQPGEAVYQPDRLLHAYLEGQNVEIMANSDNVLRAGLTSKHIDAAELVKITNFTPTNPEDFKVNVARGEDGIRSFDTPFEDFLLRELEIPPGARRQLLSVRSQILLFFSGEQLVVADEESKIELLPGQSCFSCKGNRVTLRNPTQRTAQVFIGC